MALARSDSLRCELALTPEVRVGDPVPIILRVTNVGRDTLELHLQGRTIAFDLTVTDATGAVVWRRLEGATLQSILRIDRLGPGKALALSETWDQRTRDGKQVRPGLYTVAGAVMTESEPLRTPASPIRITAR